MAEVGLHTADLTEVRLAYQMAGHGPRLIVLLHGWPQTSLCWRKVVPALAEEYSVVAADLRGYGQSSLTTTGYEKRSAARDLHELIEYLGHSSVFVVGHDRGARVAHRWALDNPADIERLVLLDILPTREVMTTFDRDSASTMWHWFFHNQSDLPERLLQDNIEPYLRHFLHLALQDGAIDDETFAAYVAAFSNPGYLHASLEDYRAGFGPDLILDTVDHQAGRRVSQPLLTLWGADGGLGQKDVLTVWRRYADDVRGEPIERCRHYLPEEAPRTVSDRIRAFLR